MNHNIKLLNLLCLIYVNLKLQNAQNEISQSFLYLKIKNKFPFVLKLKKMGIK
jgi:hypothetical protein